jgi:D-xylulose reductase
VIKGMFRYGPGAYETAINLISSGRLEVESLITRRVKFEEAEEAFKNVKEGKGIKIVIQGPIA